MLTKTECLKPAQDGVTLYWFNQLTRPFPPHLHSSFTVGAVLSGASVIQLPEGQISLSPGKVLVIPPYTPHSCRPEATHGECSWLSFHVMPPAQNISAPCRKESRLLTARCQWQKWEAHARAVIHDPASLDSAYLRELILLPDSMPDKPHSSAESLCSILRQQCSHAFSLAMLEQLTNQNRFAIIRAFKARYGITPYKYLESMRIEYAQTLLATGMPLAECAQDAGFYDQSHFNRCFKSLLGITPGKWKKICKP